MPFLSSTTAVSPRQDPHDSEGHEESTEESTDDHLMVAPDVVEVRRNAGLAALVGAAASAVAIAWLSRAATTGSALDWAMVALMGVVAAAYLRGFVDARIPLLVADTQGIRIRLGRTWRGLPWGALAEVEHTPRQGLLRDGRLVLLPHNSGRVLEELDPAGRRQVAVTARLYGAPFAVPLGLTTRLTGAEEGLTAALRQLAGAGTRVVEPVVEQPAVEQPAVEQPSTDRADERHSDQPDVDRESDDRDAVDAPDGRPRFQPRDPRPALAAAISAVAERFQRAQEDSAAEAEGLPEADREPPELVASPTPSPLRDPRVGTRAEVRAEFVRGPADPDEPAGRELRRPGSVSLVEDTVAWGDRVRPIATARDAVEPLVIDDFVVEPAADPVIGPEISAARTRIGLTVDGLAERTRIRPHVIESIEVDDFAPCGGDFYARGHLRTLARVLGIDVTPLLAHYDERYADAPISPRRVFEAELATGVGGSIRGTRGGPNWSLLVSVVMALVLAWSVARLVMDTPVELHQQPPALGGLGRPGPDPAPVARPVALELTATADVRVVVRNRNGKVLHTAELTPGQSIEWRVTPPVRVHASDGAAVEARVAGRSQGTLGSDGEPVTAVFD